MSETRKKNQRVVAGHHSIMEVLKVRPKDIAEIWMRENWPDSSPLAEILGVAKKHGIQLRTKSEKSLGKFYVFHQGALAFVDSRPRLDLGRCFESGSGTILALDSIEDPQNLGSCLRSAWLFGARAVVVPQVRSASLTPAVMKVAAGGAEHVPLEIVSNLPQALGDFKKKGAWVYGLSGTARTSIWELELSSPVVWVVGAESRGLRANVGRACDELVRIPMVDEASSFNAAMAATIALAETRRQNRDGLS